MIATIQKWGNSQGLRVTKDILRKLNLYVGDRVILNVKKDKIIINLIDKDELNFTLNELVSKMPKNYKSKELSWGKKEGCEWICNV